MAKSKDVDLDALRLKSLEELARGPDKEWTATNAPNLFENWWEGYRVEHRLTKRSKAVAQAAWYACAASLGVYDESES